MIKQMKNGIQSKTHRICFIICETIITKIRLKRNTNKTLIYNSEISEKPFVDWLEVGVWDIIWD